MVKNIMEIKNPGGSNHLEQLVGFCLGLIDNLIKKLSKNDQQKIVCKNITRNNFQSKWHTISPRGKNCL